MTEEQITDIKSKGVIEADQWGMQQVRIPLSCWTFPRRKTVWPWWVIDLQRKLRRALERNTSSWIMWWTEGDGAFYGPKIDFHLEDSIGRTWQCRRDSSWISSCLCSLRRVYMRRTEKSTVYHDSPRCVWITIRALLSVFWLSIMRGRPDMASSSAGMKVLPISESFWILSRLVPLYSAGLWTQVRGNG